MAIQEVFFASVQVAGSSKNQRLASASVRVSPTDARAYIAAADQTARDATKVGLLLDSLIDMTIAAGSNAYKMWRLDSQFINDAYAPPAIDADVYNSNKWKVTYQTTNNGLPTLESFYIPQRETGFVMESNGINVDLTDTEAANLIVQLLDTGVSSYGTAITSVVEIVANDV